MKKQLLSLVGAWVLCVGLSSPAIAADALDATEKALVAHIDANLDAAHSELEQVVNINSGTFNLAGVKAVGMVFKAQYEALGFNTRWLDGAAFERAGHLVAEYGERGPKLLLIGHLDTVFARDDAFQRYQPLDGNRVAGPGITDMKGGNVIMVHALRALKAQGVLENLQVRVVLTGDEEASGKPLAKSKQALIEAAQWADIALGFEDGDSNIETAVVARRGSVTWELAVTGKPAHSSQIFTDAIGYGAIFEAARVLDGMRQQLDGLGNLTINPGIILGGTTLEYDAVSAAGNAFGKSNVVAKTLLVRGGLRASTPQELTSAIQKIDAIVSQSLAHTTSEFSLGEGYPPMAPSEANYALLEQYSAVSVDLGYGPVRAVNPRNAGAADISFAADHVEMALDGLGLMGSGGHTKDETADMTSFAKNMHKAALLMYRLSQP